MDLSIIIINWNSKVYVEACLRSIFQHPPSVTFEVVVLDSGSYDGCGEMIARDFPRVCFIQSPDNIGFARANNLAVSYAKGNTFFFLNPDTEVSAGAIMALYRVAREVPNAGAVGARLLNTDGTLQTSCVQAFPTILNQMLISDSLIRLFPNSPLWGKVSLFQPGIKPAQVEALSGAAIMIRREVFERVSGFCEDYFMYSEDIDLCFQVNRSGFQNLYVSEVNITHHGGRSSSQRPSRFSTIAKVEAVRRYFARNSGLMTARFYRCSMGLSAFGRLLVVLPGTSKFLPEKHRARASHAFVKWKYILAWAFWGIRSSSCSGSEPQSGISEAIALTP